MFSSAASLRLLAPAAASLVRQVRGKSHYYAQNPYRLLDRPAAVVRKWEARELKKRQKRLQKTGGVDRSRPHEVVFEDARKMSRLQQRLLKGLAEAMTGESLRHDLVGLGINLTGVDVAEDYSGVTCRWTTTRPAVRLQVDELLGKKAEEVRTALEEIVDVGTVPKLTFKFDLDYVTSVKMEESYKELKAKEGIYLDEMSQVSTYAVKSKTRIQEVLELTKFTNLMGFDRQPIYDDLCYKVKKAKATHRVTRKAGLDDRPHHFDGFDYQEATDDTYQVDPVKRFLGLRKKAQRQMEKESSVDAT